MKIFIINGQGGSGKTSFEQFIQHYAWAKYYKQVSVTSIIDPIKGMAQQIGWEEGQKSDKDRAFLHDLKVLLSNYNNYDINYIIKKIKTAKELNRAALFIDMREKKDIEFFKKAYPEIKTVLVKRGNFRKYNNSADDNIMDIEYDIVIDNDGTLADLREHAEKFYNDEIAEYRND